ncbi:TetR/AcrR family transcriptional regulator [Variovorax sp. RHLX14]|uniref:TetR/AcrR family transcriptional regulator n=1 Tax=Variovorax sp. RHLX14 TaxID=1259731 RepID=UPI003F445F94
MSRAQATPHHEHYGRLLDGMGAAVAAKGYAETTIADIVREAGVSRRSFYEHFATKSDCLLALYKAGSMRALTVLAEAVDPDQPWQTQVAPSLSAYLVYRSQAPALLRMLFVDIVGMGPEGLAVRGEVNLEIAHWIQAATHEEGRLPISIELAMTVIGGINELVLRAIQQGRSDDLRPLIAPLTQMVLAVAGYQRMSEA